MYQGRYITLSDTSNDTSDCGHVSHTCTCGCSVIYWTHNASLQVMPQVCLMIMHYSLPASPVASFPVPALAPAASPRAALLAHKAAPRGRHERQRAPPQQQQRQQWPSQLWSHLQLLRLLLRASPVLLPSDRCCLCRQRRQRCRYRRNRHCRHDRLCYCCCSCHHVVMVDAQI